LHQHSAVIYNSVADGDNAAVLSALKGKRLELSTANVVHTSYTTWQDLGWVGSTCIDPEVKRSNVKVTRLWSVLPARVCMSIWLLSFLVMFYCYRYWNL